MFSIYLLKPPMNNFENDLHKLVLVQKYGNCGEMSGNPLRKLNQSRLLVQVKLKQTLQVWLATGLTQSKFAQTGNQVKLTSNSHKLANRRRSCLICLIWPPGSAPVTFSHLINSDWVETSFTQFVQVSSSYIKFNSVGSSLIWFDQVWSNLIMFNQLSSKLWLYSHI